MGWREDASSALCAGCTVLTIYMHNRPNSKVLSVNNLAYSIRTVKSLLQFVYTSPSCVGDSTLLSVSTAVQTPTLSLQAPKQTLRRASLVNCR